MAASLSITEAQLFQALGDFISGLVSIEVVRGLQNRTSMPQGDFITMSPAGSVQLNRPVASWDASTVTYSQSKQWAAQIDCYGAASNDTAQLIVSMFRTPYACDALASYGWALAPLYAEDPRQMPLVAGEEQYIERWSFNAILQYNPSITVTQQSADTLTAGVINVDSTYPA